MFKIETAKRVPNTDRRLRSRTVVYFWPRGETIMDNLMNRRTRPVNEYRRLLPDVYAAVGVRDSSNLSARCSQKAGCACGCSPGFIVEGYDSALYRSDVHVDVIAE